MFQATPFRSFIASFWFLLHARENQQREAKKHQKKAPIGACP